MVIDKTESSLPQPSALIPKCTRTRTHTHTHTHTHTCIYTPHQHPAAPGQPVQHLRRNHRGPPCHGFPRAAATDRTRAQFEQCLCVCSAAQSQPFCLCLPTSRYHPPRDRGGVALVCFWGVGVGGVWCPGRRSVGAWWGRKGERGVLWRPARWWGTGGSRRTC